MGRASLVSTLTAGLMAILFAGSALAYGGHRHHHRSHSHFGVFIGAPAFWYAPYPFYYHPPAYYYPPVVVSPPAPTVYIERPDNVQAAPERTAQDNWYYCPESQAYYPYVKQCAKGWQRVAPQPQP